MGEARKVKERGLIRYLRFSSHDEPENIIKFIDTDESEGIR
jgi:predicted aldo/keto reductase-like oxidoreductase